MFVSVPVLLLIVFGLLSAPELTILLILLALGAWLLSNFFVGAILVIGIIAAIFFAIYALYVVFTFCENLFGRIKRISSKKSKQKTFERPEILDHDEFIDILL